jgi:hypothetical protein
MNPTLVRALRFAAFVCLACGWFISTGYEDSWINPTPWELAGLALLALSFIP